MSTKGIRLRFELNKQMLANFAGSTKNNLETPEYGNKLRSFVPQLMTIKIAIKKS